MKLSKKNYREKLKCETNTIEMTREILACAEEKFSEEQIFNNKIHVNFEHGQ